MLSPTEQEELEWQFGPGQTLALRGASRSTFGAQLQHASTRYKTSNGKTLNVARMREVRVLNDDGTSQKKLEAWPYIYVKKEQPAAREDSAPVGRLDADTADTEDDRDIDLERIERGQRIERRLVQLSRQEQTVLEVLYGPSGLYWTGRSHGRRWALLPLTRSGGRRLEESGEANPTRWLLEVALQSPRPAWLQAALDQAEQLQQSAEGSWKATAPKPVRGDEETRLL